MKTMVLSVLVVCALAGSVPAEVRTVPSDHPTIQAAIDASREGDTVVVLTGTYHENINFKGKNITVTGSDPNDAGTVGYTVINGDNKGSAVVMNSGETSRAVLTGFTITQGTGTYYAAISSTTERVYAGGGICCSDSSPTITRNIIIRNAPTISVNSSGSEVTLCVGGGIGGFYASPTITHNIIRNNTAYIGGGIACYLGTPTIRDNIIYDNAGYVGGGLFMIAGALTHNTILHNSCDYGAEVGLSDGQGGNCYLSPTPDYGLLSACNNIVYSALSGGGIYFSGSDSALVFAYNDVFDNQPGDYTGGTLTIRPESGNISADPLFRSVPGRDYHLTLESPCINAGDPGFTPAPDATDMDGESRIFGGRVDIGADEYVGYVKPTAVAGLNMHVLAPLTPVALDGGGSFFYDPAGPTSYKWRQVSGPAGTFDDPNQATPVFTPQAEGTYVLELVVADDQYASAPDQLVIFVGPNHVPVAHAGPNKACPPGPVSLDGSGSSDPDPIDSLRYSWKQTEGPAVVLNNADGAAPSFVAHLGEQYSFELVVSDGIAESAPSKVTITGVEAALTYGWLRTDSLAASSLWPDVSGMRTVFVTNSGTAYQWKIMTYDFLTNESATFSSGMSLEPRIDNDLVVWWGGPTSPSSNGLECTSVFLRNLTDNTQVTLRTAGNTQSYSHPAISGHTVVWVQHVGIDKAVPDQWRNMPYDICGADITDVKHPVYFTIAEKVGKRDPFPYQNPAFDSDRVVDISGHLVVWEGEDGIYAADISNLNDIKVFPVCTDPGGKYCPAVSGKYVVWMDQRNDVGDIYGADVSDPQNVKVFEIAGGKGVQKQPTIDGPMVAYVDGDTSSRIKMACITARCGIADVERPGGNNTPGILPAYDGTMVVWINGTYVSRDVLGFGYSVPDGPVLNQTTGKRYDYIQHAISLAGAGSEIVVPAGVYQEKLRFLGKQVTVRSTDPNDPAVVAATVLTGEGTLALFAEGETNASLLNGLTLTGGYQGVCCSGSSPTIRNCVIGRQAGAGVRLVNQSKPLLTRCRIVGNEADGIDMHNTSTATAQNSMPVLTNCIVAGNRLIGVRGGQPTIMLCTITENLKDGINCTAAAIMDSIVYANSGKQIVLSARAGANYSDVQGGISGTGNINADPRFVLAGQWTAAGWVEGDYHLKSQGWRWDAQNRTWTSDDVTSPCIDGGEPLASLRDEPVTIPGVPDADVVNTRLDMGAYGGTPEASIKRANP